MRLAPLLLCWLVLAGSVRAQPKEKPGLSFAWPVPSTLEVEETSRVDGKLARFKHTVELRLAGDELRLRFVRSEALRVNDEQLEGGPRLGGELAELASFYPELRLSKEGRPLGTTGLEEAVERWAKLRRELDPTTDERALRQAREQFLAGRAMLESRALNMWQLWAASWIGAPAEENQQIDGSVTLPVGQRQVKARSTLVNQGPSKKGGVHLAREIVLAGEEARAAFAEMGKGLSGAQVPRLQSFARTTRLEVFTDPKTLQPRLAASRQVTTVLVEGEEPRVREELRQYTFRWIRRGGE